jgi:hypothetical protein
MKDRLRSVLVGQHFDDVGMFCSSKLTKYKFSIKHETLLVLIQLALLVISYIYQRNTTLQMSDINNIKLVGHTSK